MGPKQDSQEIESVRAWELVLRQDGGAAEVGHDVQRFGRHAARNPPSNWDNGGRAVDGKVPAVTSPRPGRKHESKRVPRCVAWAATLAGPPLHRGVSKPSAPLSDSAVPDYSRIGRLVTLGPPPREHRGLPPTDNQE